eukprot:4558367-Prorocentrum_lima.AAC.1
MTSSLVGSEMCIRDSLTYIPSGDLNPYIQPSKEYFLRPCLLAWLSTLGSDQYTPAVVFPQL